MFSVKLDTSSHSQLKFLSWSYFHLRISPELFLWWRIKGIKDSQLPRVHTSLNTGLASRVDFFLLWRSPPVKDGRIQEQLKWQVSLGLCFAQEWLLRGFWHILRRPIKAEKALRTNSVAPSIAAKLRTFQRAASAASLCVCICVYIYIYVILFLTVLGLCCCEGVSLAAASRAPTLHCSAQAELSGFSEMYQRQKTLEYWQQNQFSERNTYFFIFIFCQAPNSNTQLFPGPMTTPYFICDV